jgi:hypothetical protein
MRGRAREEKGEKEERGEKETRIFNNNIRKHQYL